MNKRAKIIAILLTGITAIAGAIFIKFNHAKKDGINNRI